MPSEIPEIRFRLAEFRQEVGNKSNRFMKAIAKHPQIKEALKNERCPICGKTFDECEYFRRL